MTDYPGAPAPVTLSTLQTLAARLSQVSETTLDRELVEQTLSALNEVLVTTQQRMAYEESLNKITAVLQQQADLGIILEQTLAELGQALGARRARLRLQITPPGSSESLVNR
jgi:hypothetical protein